MARVQITSRFIEDVMRSRVVREALAARADRIHARAEQIAAQESVDAAFALTEGTRRRGRPYARVSTDAVGQEWGDTTIGRRRILGRAAGEG
jgi:hypothetical protein